MLIALKSFNIYKKSMEHPLEPAGNTIIPSHALRGIELKKSQPSMVGLNGSRAMKKTTNSGVSRHFYKRVNLQR